MGRFSELVFTVRSLNVVSNWLFRMPLLLLPRVRIASQVDCFHTVDILATALLSLSCAFAFCLKLRSLFHSRVTRMFGSVWSFENDPYRIKSMTCAQEWDIP